MPLARGGRMLKRWRYVGVYGPELMLCAGDARIGPMRQVWWAVWDREVRAMHERTRMLLGRGRVRLGEPGRARVDDGAVSIDLRFDEGDGVEVVSPHDGGHIWTHKQVVTARGRARLGSRELAVDGPAIIDDSAGYHARHTSWRWSAGVGTAADGRPVAWNLVDGVHDAAEASERTVWVDGHPREVGPVGFTDDLAAVSFAEGGELRCAAEATRERNDNLLLFRSRYRQPFGTFSGSLPGVAELAQGYGVMERHEVVW
jgi:hypothetical protein